MRTITITATNMALLHSDKEWLKNIEDESIRFYSFEDFTDVVYIGGGRGYGTVFKAKLKTLGRMVAYKLLHSQNEDEIIEDFVKEVGDYNNDNFIFEYYCFT